MRISARAALLTGLLVCLGFGAARPALAGGVYFVKQGDTLSGISRTFGIEVELLRKANPGVSAAISPGDKLRIPDRAHPVPGAPSADSRTRGRDEETRVLQALCREETVYHTVVRGDTLHAISRRYGTVVDELVRLNGMRSGDRLAIGRNVVVRRSGPRSHRAAAGETLRGIATRYGMDVADLVRINHLDGKTVVAGERLLLESCDAYAGGGLPSLGPAAGSAPLATAAAPAPSARDTEVGVPTPSSESASARVISLARELLDIPYRFGGTTLRGIDCSAYVQHVFRKVDVALPRTAREQFGLGARVGRDDLAVGDLVFFRTYASFPSHVGIYLGDDLFIHASSMVRKVTIDSIDMPYYRKRFLGARRLVPESGASLAAAP